VPVRWGIAALGGRAIPRSRSVLWHDAGDMPFVNATSFASVDVPMLDRDGRDVVVVILKSTWRIKASGDVSVVEEDASPVRLVDILRNPDDKENPRQSARYPSDLCVEKRGTDVVVVGDALSRKPVTFVDVAVKVRDKMLAARVHGAREYFRHLADVAISASVPFERMPVEYERAFGGMSEDFSIVEPRNPAGVGIAKNQRDLVGKLAPQIEAPSLPHKTAADRHPPVGLGAVLTHWSPRRECAGTFDEKWKATRAPLMPLDFDIAHNNVASPGLMFDPPLAPGDPISVLGMSHDLFELRLPPMPVVLRARYDDRSEEARPVVDTVLLEPTRGRMEMVVRKAFTIGRGARALREIRADVDD
jgi:hypothetical protein